MNFEVVGKIFHITFPYSPEMVTEIKETVEQRRWNPGLKCWTAPVTPRNQFLALLHGGMNPYEIYDSVLQVGACKMAYEPIIKKLCPKLTLYDYQWIMLTHLIQRKRCINGAWMRMGKSLPAILALILLKITGAWWVTSVPAKAGLIRELRKWRLNPDMYLLTYAAFTDLVYDSPHLIPSAIIYDECQALKSVKSKRGKAARDASKIQLERYDQQGIPSYFWGLSGTPDPNDPSDWFNLLESCRPGYIYQSNLTLFKLCLGHFEMVEGEHGGKYPKIDKTMGANGWKPAELKILGEKLRGLVEIFDPKDWKDIPPPEDIIHELPVPKDVKSAIKIIKQTEDGLALRNIYRQLDDGFQYEYSLPDVETLKKERTIVDYGTPKQEQFERDLDLYEDIGRLVVYAAFTASVERLTSISLERGWAVLQITGKGLRPLGTTAPVDELLESMDASTDKRTMPKLIVISQADTGNTGMEFSASSAIIFYSYSQRSDSYEQARARMSSGASSTNKVIIHYHYLAIGKIMYQSLLLKKDVQEIPKKILIEALEADLDSNLIVKEPLNYTEMKV